MGGSIVMPREHPRSQVWNDKREAGRTEQAIFRSNILGNSRNVTTYHPIDLHPGHTYRLIVVLDEEVFNDLMHLPLILDDLIASQTLQPTVVAMVGNVNRDSELSCNPRFSRMLADELIPWIKDRLKLPTYARTAIAGASLGGLAAACAGFQASNAFDSVIALSGSFRWRPVGDQEPEWFARQLSISPAVPVSFFIGVGSFETGTPHEPANPSLLTAARHLRDVLRAREYKLTYREFPGAHEPLSWSLNIGEAIVATQTTSK